MRSHLPLNTSILLLAVLLLLGTAACYRGHVPLNGSFERLDAQGSPIGWVLGTDPEGSQTTISEITMDSWRGSRAVSLGSNGSEAAFATLEMPVLFSDLRMLHTNGGEFYYKVIHSGISGSNMLFSIDFLDQSGSVVSEYRFSPPAMHVGDGIWHSHHFKIDILESRMARTAKISFSINGGEEKSTGAWIVDELQVFEEPPNLTIGSLRSEKALVGIGEAFEIGFNLANIGGENHYGFHSSVILDDGLVVQDGITERELGVVEPGVEYTLSWTVVAERPGSYVVEVSIQDQGISMIAIIGAADFSHPQERPPRARISIRDQKILLENPDIRLILPSLGTAGLFSIQCWDGAWRDMGVVLPMGHVLHLSDSGERELLLLNPLTYRTSSNATGVTLTLDGSIFDVDGIEWTFSYSFGLDSGDSHVRANLEVQAGGTRRLLRLSGPLVLAGEGSFGAARQQGLFCGLEYLAEGEVSSGTDFVWEPKNLRTVPHPLKVTVPLMAIEGDNSTIALSWNPLEKWDGVNMLPSARFVSPNWIQGQANHHMSVFVPSIPDWVSENEYEASTPYQVQSPLTITTNIFVSPDSGILDAFSWWLEENGIPDPPEMPRSYEETIELSTTCYKDICWVPENKAWKHTHLDDPRWIFWDTMVALPLWHHSDLTGNGTLKEEIREQVLLALRGLGGWAGMDLALHLGNVKNALSSGYHTVRSLADTQREDGSWPFTPDAARQFLGTPGDTSSGWVASKARVLLKFGRITGDPEAIAAGLKALDYLDTQIRPEGAQTWELQLHVPDVLASSYIMECYLEAYSISGREEYLEGARYWALTGLPFIYLWNPPERPVLRYGSIPVFGATSYVSPWFGIIVQWNGLDYAYQLLQLSKFDETLPWRTIAEGITICGMQMQRVPGMAHEEYLGMYPDAYSALKGDEQYFFDINPRFISLCAFALMGHDQTTQTEILNLSGDLVHISTLGKIGNSSYGDNVLKFDSVYAEGEISFASIAGISRPEFVTVNFDQLPEASDLSTVDSGWVFTSEGNLILKFEHAHRNRVIISGVIPQGSRRFSADPVWEFNGVDSEGWTSTNMLDLLSVDDGVLSTRSTGADPFMVGPSIRIGGRQDAIAQIRMKTSRGGAGQLFWVTKESPHYSESKSISFEVAGDGTFHVYTLDIGQNSLWNGTIRQIRFDPINVDETDIEIDYIRIPEPVLSILALLLLILHRLVGWNACRKKIEA